MIAVNSIIVTYDMAAISVIARYSPNIHTETLNIFVKCFQLSRVRYSRLLPSS